MINKYLIEASKRYKEYVDDSFYINPISEVDGEIIQKIQDLLVEYQLNDLFKIFRDYKSISDQDVLKALKDHKINHEVTDSQNEHLLDKDSKFVKMNDMMNTRLQKRFVTDYAMDYVIEAETDQPIAIILLNESDMHINKVAPYTNKRLFYSSENKRDKDILMLDQIL